MPLLPFTYAPISQRVADRLFGTTAIAQVATWDALNVRVNGGELQLELGFRVAYHGLNNGQLGEPLGIGQGIDSWHQTLFANNDCAVYLNPADAADPRNGQILYYATPTPEGLGWETRHADGTSTALVGGLNAAQEPLLKQGDAFALQMENPLALAQMIRYHLNAANQAPFSKFA